MTRHCAGGLPVCAARIVPALTIAFGLCAAGAFAQDRPLTINDKQYFEKRGLDVLVFTNEYNGMFFDEKTAGVELIHHGVRTSVRTTSSSRTPRRSCSGSDQGRHIEERTGEQGDPGGQDGARFRWRVR